MGVPAAVAAALTPGSTNRARLTACAPALVLLAASLGYGAIRLSNPADTTASRPVALLAAQQQGDWTPLETPRGRQKLDESVAHLNALPAGTSVAVLAESAIVTTAASVPQIIERLRPLAAQRRMDIVAGVIVTDDKYDEALIFPSDGGAPLTYRKQHMVPGVEPYRPGTERVALPDPMVAAGIAICKDLDFLDLPRAYRRDGAGLMLVPAWDFDRDGWLHSRMAVLRGVENGFALVRPSANGRLTVSDAYGRILAEDATRDRDLVTVTAEVPTTGVDTLYTRWGDWLAWLSLALAALAAASTVTSRRTDGHREAAPSVDTGEREVVGAGS